MKPAVTALIVVAVAAVSFAIGYRSSQSQSPPPTTAAPAPPPPIAAALPAGAAANRVAAVLSQPASIERTAELSALLVDLGPDAIDEVREVFRTARIDVDEIPSALLATWWVRYQPEAAFAWVRKYRRFSNLINNMVIREWARHDPHAAAAAMLQLDVRETRILVVRSLAIGWAESGAPGFRDFALEHLARAEQQLALDALMAFLVHSKGPEAAIEFAESVPEDAERFQTFALQRAAKMIARVRGPLAAEFAERHGAKAHGWGIYSFVASEWAKDDGPATMAWVAALPAGKQRDNAVDAALRNWAAADEDAALAWVPDAPVEPWLQPAIQTYASVIYRKDRPAGVAALARIDDAPTRERVTVAFLRNWLEHDPAAAQVYLEAANLPDEMTKKVLEPKPDQPTRRLDASK